MFPITAEEKCLVFVGSVPFPQQGFQSPFVSFDEQIAAKCGTQGEMLLGQLLPYGVRSQGCVRDEQMKGWFLVCFLFWHIDLRQTVFCASGVCGEKDIPGFGYGTLSVDGDEG